jgi:hypothetical protein
MKRALLAAVLLATPSFAQAPQTTPEYTLKLTLPELQTIGKALTKQPYEEVAGLLNNLNAQISAQQKAINPPVEPPK